MISITWRMVARLLTSIALTVGLFGCGNDAGPETPVVRPIKMLDLETGAGIQVLEFPGTVRAGLTAELGFEVPGRLEALPVIEGQAVQEGDVLARIDPRDYQAKLESELAKLRAAKAEYERMLKLFEEDVASQQQLDTRQRNYEVMQTTVARARKVVEDTRIVAPFDGVVARTLVENFENVQAKQGVVLLENDALFKVRAEIPEQDAARMPPDKTLAERTARMRPQIAISALGGRSFDAQLSEFATSADPRTRTFAATFVFENPGGVSLASGMTAVVRVSVPAEAVGETGFMIPSVAVSSDPAGRPIVWVIDPSTLVASQRAVELGPMSGSQVRVRSGLDGSESIAISGVSFLHEGMIVSRASN